VSTCLEFVTTGLPFVSATIHLPWIFWARLLLMGLSLLSEVQAVKTLAPQMRMAASIQCIIFFIVLTITLMI
jgi:hypothetical protein